MYKKVFFIVLSFCVSSIMAQEPEWSVDVSKYQFSMNFTASLNVNGTTLSSPKDKVAVFVDGEIRGVSSLVYVSNFNKYVAFLTVYANINDELLSFKIYDSTNQNIVEVSKTENFSIDSVLGGVFQSYSVASPELSDEINLSSFGFLNVTSLEEVIEDDKINIVLPVGTDLVNLIPEFTVSKGAGFFVDKVVQTSGVSSQDFTNTIVYTLLSENQAVLKTFGVSVSIEQISENPPIIILETNENVVVNKAPISINLKTNIAIATFDESSFLLNNAVVSSIEKESELTYKLQIVPVQQGEFNIEVLENKIFNNHDEGNLSSNKLFFVYDLINPYVKSIKRKNPIDEITTNDVLIYEVVFSEEVEGVSSSDFESVANSNISLTKEDEYTYTVSITNVEDFYGVVSLHIITSNTIKDKAGNLLINSVFNAYQN